ncbi:hypothetical protein DZ860_14450 [Vibrio sinensis]|uniref:Uncharacterized protein n=1 Tax=Vibrio sinensis TaxID=2302434 RepID=A0A3A6R1A7_9VIBR|nr:hypothetical protein [Vibrio sinensis]RJX69678.1 hypothetical protein DZ860_14450 [Vibrio sinensis]
MEQQEFETLVKALCETNGLPQALELLRASDNEDIAEAAQSLTGQFAVQDIDGEQRIYHVTLEENDDGEEQEFVEHVMNEGEDVIRFVAWFFDVMFEVKRKDTYLVAGKTYQQTKRAK